MPKPVRTNPEPPPHSDPGRVDPLSIEIDSKCALMRAVYIMCHMMMRRLDAVAQPEGLTGSRWILLVVVRDVGAPMTITNLSEHLCISPQNVSRMVGSLEEEGLVARDTSGPGRTVKVTLTELGLQRLEVCDAHADDCADGMTAGVTDAAIDRARKTLEHMIRNTVAMESQDPNPRQDPSRPAASQEKTR
ncbi:MAG: MarR family winged helix-turn-helix transcriptional regulator [Phycisphaerales bacterium]